MAAQYRRIVYLDPDECIPAPSLDLEDAKPGIRPKVCKPVAKFTESFALLVSGQLAKGCRQF